MIDKCSSLLEIRENKRLKSGESTVLPKKVAEDDETSSEEEEENEASPNGSNDPSVKHDEGEK